MAWAFERAEGFEHQIVSTAGGGIASTITNATISAAAARTGSYGMRASPGAATAGYWQMPISTTSCRSMFLKGHVKIPTLPASDLTLADWTPGSGVRSRLILTSDGHLKFRSWDGVTEDTSTNTYSAGDWVSVEAFVTISATTGNRVHYWKLNGTVEGSFSDTQTSTAVWSHMRVGSPDTSGPAATIDWDDVVIFISDVVETTYPSESAANLQVRMHNVAGDGTHLIGTGTYQDSSGGSITNSTTTAWTFIDDISGGTDYIAKTAGTESILNSHLSFTYQSASSAGVPEGATPKGGTAVYFAIAESASQAEVCYVDVTIAGSTQVCYTGDIGSTSVVYKKGWLANNAWTISNIDAAHSYYGSNDPSPNPRVYSLFMQIPYLPNPETTDSATVYFDLQASGREGIGPYLIATGGDDGYVAAYDANWVPNANLSAVTNQVISHIESSLAGGNYYFSQGLLRWDTSDIPDGATITGATLRVDVYANVHTDTGFQLKADWYDWGASIGTEDYSTSPGTNAHAGTNLTGFTTGVTDFALTNLTNVNKTGYTYLRLHIEGTNMLVSPTSDNYIQIGAYEATTYEIPRLIVTYTTGGTEYTDSATITVDLQASGTDIKAIEYTESATALVDLQASGTELAEYVESGTVYVDIQASGTDEYGQGTTYTDSATISLDLQVSPDVGRIVVDTPLTNFTGADENPLSEGGAWNGTIRTESSPTRVPAQRLSNVAAIGGTSLSESVYNTVMGPDFDVFLTIAQVPGSAQSISVHARIQNEGTTSSKSYAVSYTTDSGLGFSQILNNTAQLIPGQTYYPVTLAAGDKTRIRVIGSTIERWYQKAGESWTYAGSITNTDTSGMGKAGFYLAGSSKADDWGAYTVVATDYIEATDSATVYIDLQASGTDEYTPAAGVEYTDSATVLVDLQTSATEVREIPDSATVLVDLQASGTELAEYVDDSAILVDLDASGTELLAKEYTDVATSLIDLQASGTEVAEFIESATIPLDLEASGTELLAKEYTDAGTALVDLSASGTDLAEYIEAETVPIDLQCSGTELLAKEYTDAAEILVDLQASGADIVEYAEAFAVLLAFSVASEELREIADAVTTYFLLTPSGTEYVVSVQILRPDADIDANNWQVAPLWSKLNDESNATYIYATAI